MRSFTDTKGRKWTFEVTFKTYKTLRAQGFDATDIGQWDNLANDPDVLISVLMELCAGEISDRGLSQDEFEDGFDLEVVEVAVERVVESLIDFFPRQKQEAVRTLWAKVNATQKEVTAAALAKLNSPETEKQIEEMLTRQLTS